MGYDAFVRYNCWEEGKTKPFPFDFRAKWDEQHRYLEVLSPECEDKENWEPCDEQDTQLILWMENACEHYDMCITHVRLANMSGMSAFRWALAIVGVEQFPALHKKFPTSNGGSSSPDIAAEILADVERFVNLTEIGQATYLIDTTSSEVIRTYDNFYRGAFHLLGSIGIALGLDQDSFYISNLKTEEILFRAMRFEQKPNDDTTLQKDYFKPQQETEVVFTNLDTNDRFVTGASVTHSIPFPDGEMYKNGRANMICPRFMHVEKRKFGAERFKYITEPLMEVCRASIATGNPIQWT